jgi:transcriptional regulator with XRE-family HTH domain
MKLDVESMIVGLRTELSCAEIARRSGISRTHLHRLQTGQSRRPSYETVHRLERVVRSLGTTPRKA